MGTRKRLGLFFTYDENWIGGTYYILNLIEALKLLPEERMPLLTIFYSNEQDAGKIQAIGYPHMDFLQTTLKLPFIKRGLNFLSRKIIGRNVFDFTDAIPSCFYDAVFPLPLQTHINTRMTKKAFYWIADFQEMHLPQLFSQEELGRRRTWYGKVATSHKQVIFSSYDAKCDFDTYYPGSSVKQYVLQFAVTHPQYETVDFSATIKKYNLPQQYFFCPNQFWSHKNQLAVLEAICLLRDKFNRDIRVVFSGKEYDYRNADYFNGLKQFVKDNGIEKNVSFLGFIDRKEQLAIMKNALGVIQPSFFEGWSTVVEDAKAMNQTLVVSAIKVHVEQLGDNALYFSPDEPHALATLLAGFKPLTIDFQYEQRRFKFANDFINILEGRGKPCENIV